MNNPMKTKDLLYLLYRSGENLRRCKYIDIFQMNYVVISIVIIFLLALSFLVWHYLFRNKTEAFNESQLFEGCVKYPQFAMKSGGKGSPGSENQTVSNATIVTDGQLVILNALKNEISKIKTKVPVNFLLGTVTMQDKPKQGTSQIKVPDIKLDVSLPRIRLNFTLPYPELGPTGATGKDGDPFIGPTGPTGITGPTGESGYWGTIKDTLY